ncbi:MAG: DUF1559 domain-containing protein [Armatimonadetes bacterium]|nr:DUF1559 domain-containing protein [Armatimonadota bacterium]
MNARPSMTTRELLLSAVAVAVLSTALWPAIRQVREHAEADDQCRTNLKQVALGVLMYSEDYDSKLPAESQAGTQPQDWRDAIYPYIKNDEVLQCPLWQGEKRSSYGYNGFYLSYRRRGRMDAPAQTVLLCDAGRDDAGETLKKYYHVDPPAMATHKWVVRPDFRHQGCNVAYVDGHVKLTPTGDFYPSTVAEGGTWKGDAKNPPNLKKPPAVDRWWSGNGK